MTLPGNPGYQAPTEPLTQLVRDIEDLKRSVTSMQALLVANGTIQSPNFNGVAATNTVGTTGYGLDGPTGNAVFNNIALRGGIIGNDALANPVSPLAANGSTTGLSNTFGSYVAANTQTLAVPAGFTQANVVAIGVGSGSAPAGGGAIFVHCRIAGVDGDDAVNFTSSTGAGIGATGAFAKVVTGLDGSGAGTLAVTVYVGGGGGGNGLTSIAGRLSVMVLFLH